MRCLTFAREKEGGGEKPRQKPERRHLYQWLHLPAVIMLPYKAFRASRRRHMAFPPRLRWPRYLARRKFSRRDIRGEIAVSQMTMVTKTGVLTCRFMVAPKGLIVVWNNLSEFDTNAQS